MHTPYIFPSENGLRCDVRCAQLGDFAIERLDADLAFSVSEFDIDTLMRAQHTNELDTADVLHVHIDGFHMGVGGMIPGHLALSLPTCLMSENMAGASSCEPLQNTWNSSFMETLRRPRLEINLSE